MSANAEQLQQLVGFFRLADQSEFSAHSQKRPGGSGLSKQSGTGYAMGHTTEKTVEESGFVSF
ncbi:conserved hypothetical protein [Ricinus communis]|uniref:Uncharacterized protein n=1 Tax=Ricinus communis TaxID=3988 RepID=B9TDU4_RICCO|nr:conserved hypothetical protein [Ricinus communis]